MATKGKATFKHNRKANCVTLEAVLVRSDGAIQVRAVVPYEKAKAFFAALQREEKAVVMGGCGGSAHKASQALAARAAVGLVQDAADFAADKFATVLSGWNPLSSAYNAARKTRDFTTRFSPSHIAMRYAASKLRRKKRGGAAQAAEKEGEGGGGGGGGDDGEGDEGTDESKEGAEAPEGQA